VTCLSAVEAWPLRASGSIILLDWSICHIVIFRLGGVGIVVALVLTSVVGCPGVRQVHWHWDVVIGGSRGVGRVVCWPLLLLLWSLLILLGSTSPGAGSELSLTLVVIEPSQVWWSTLGPDEFDPLMPFCDVDSSCFVLVVVSGKWYFDDFI
jgi:hypothetical protein